MAKYEIGTLLIGNNNGYLTNENTLFIVADINKPGTLIYVEVVNTINREISSFASIGFWGTVNQFSPITLEEWNKKTNKNLTMDSILKLLKPKPFNFLEEMEKLKKTQSHINYINNLSISDMAKAAAVCELEIQKENLKENMKEYISSL